jgi:hypothetical protein
LRARTRKKKPNLGRELGLCAALRGRGEAHI